ncbi:MAG: nucleotidyltransferase substrate binding protein [Clostridia bacterium]|nr:nucleotidyltransferase substrate binding protein [Clostridia bacterium]
MDSIYNDIKQLGSRYKASKIVLFGSRARGDNRDNSDIDIAVYNMPGNNQSAFLDGIDSLNTLADFDVVFVCESTDANLLKNIEKDGVILMKKFDEKNAKFTDAVKRLKEAVSDYEQHGISSIRDGVIQRFEFCTELAWKTTREYLIEQGYIEMNSPKEVMRKAYACGLISDEAIWIDIINSRNLTSHIYDEATAQNIYDAISGKYVGAFEKLQSSFSK